jgi:hypothetical protein
MTSLYLVAVVLLVGVFVEVESMTKCMKGIGKLVCESNPTKAANIEIDLMDHDGTSRSIE